MSKVLLQNTIAEHIEDWDISRFSLLADDVGDSLADAEVQAIVRFREDGGGVLTARDH